MDSKITESINESDTGCECPICFNNLTTKGEHRICSLKCGHLFGWSCVKKWLDMQFHKKCPICKERVESGDLHFIFINKITTMDTSQLERVKKQLDVITEDCNRVNQENAQLKQQLLEKDLQCKMKNNKDIKYCDGGTTKLKTTFLEKFGEMNLKSSTGLFDVNSKKDLIITASYSRGLSDRYGIRKYNISRYQPLEFIPLHNLQIRDLCIHPEDNRMLTVTTDKSFKISDSHWNSTISTTTQSSSLRSCCWDLNQPNFLYIGTQLGVIAKYDVRKLTAPVCKLVVPEDQSSIEYIAPMQRRAEKKFLSGGVVYYTKLKSLGVFENTVRNKHHVLPLQGPFVSVKYHTETAQLLVTSATGNRHNIYLLEKDSVGKLNCNLERKLQSGNCNKLPSKSCFVSNEFVAAQNDSNKRVSLWSRNSGLRVYSVPEENTVLDLLALQNETGSVLYTLTEKKLNFFKLLV